MSKDKEKQGWNPIYLLVIIGIPSSVFFANSTCKELGFCLKNSQAIEPGEGANKPNKVRQVRHGGSTSFADININDKDKEKYNYEWFKKRGLNLEYQKPSLGNPGSKTAFKMLLTNKIDISQSSKSFKDLDEFKTNDLKEEQVASDAIVFYVSKNSKSDVSNVTIPQLKGILTGTIPNWIQGATNSKINVHVRDIEASGTGEIVRQKIMGGQNFKPEAIFESITTNSINAVKDDPTGIGFATAGEVCRQKNVRVLLVNNVNPCTNKKGTNSVNLTVLENGTYPKELIRPLYAIYKSSGFSKEAGDLYVIRLRSNDGKEFVRKAGMIPYQATK
jgi:ABC-type phosphate transport system substrate-binding protein